MKSKYYFQLIFILFFIIVGVIFLTFLNNNNGMKKIIKKYNLVESSMKRVELTSSKDLVISITKGNYYNYFIIDKVTTEVLEINFFDPIEKYGFDHNMNLRKIDWKFSHNGMLRMQLLMGIILDPAISEIIVQNYQNTKQYKVTFVEYHNINFFYFFEEDYKERLMPIHIKALSDNIVVYDNQNPRELPK